MFTLTGCGGWFSGTSAEQQVAGAADAGFKAVEILSWKGMDLEKVRAEVERTGCEISAILFQSTDAAKQALIANTHGIVHEDALTAFLDSIRETLNAAKVLGCINIIVTTGNERADVPRHVQRANVVRALREAAAIVSGSGVTLLLEPLNIIVDHKGYFLTTTEEGVGIIKEVGSPDVLLLYDIYHQQITEGNVINNIRANIEYIGHFHVADVPGRKQPGTGEINYKNVFKAIADTGYDKFVVFECGLSEDVSTVCRKMWALMP